MIAMISFIGRLPVTAAAAAVHAADCSQPSAGRQAAVGSGLLGELPEAHQQFSHLACGV
jgi:hypothetical protein